MQKTAIIIPCFNEEKRIKVDEFMNFSSRYPNVSFLFVNDGSTDNTLQIINDMCKSAPGEIFNMSIESNMGKAEAVRRGLLKAINMTSKSFDNIGYWDADLSAPLDSIPKMTQRLEPPEILMVFGSRVKLLNHRINRNVVRHYLGRIFATFASLALNLQIYDTQCGAKIFKNIPELKTILNRPFLVNWMFDVEIIARFLVISQSMGQWTLEDSAVEYPLENWDDISGSKLNISDFLLAPFELFKIFIFLHFTKKL